MGDKKPTAQELQKKGIANLSEDELKILLDAHSQAALNLDPFSGDDKDITCKWCGWQGKRHECKMVEVYSPPSAWQALAGREGWEWRCPKCDWTVGRHYTRIS